MTLILADSGSERRFTPQRLTGGWLRVSVRGLASGPHSGHTNLRVLLVADILHRVVKIYMPGTFSWQVVRPSTATETDDRLRLALPFTPEMFGIRPSLGVGDCLDPAAVLLGQGCDVIVERSAGARVSSRTLASPTGRSRCASAK